MNLPRPRNSAITRQSIHLYTPPSAPFHFSPCLPKKLTSVSPEGSISHKPREGLCPCTYTDRLTRSGWCFHKLRGLALTQQRKSLCLWGITPIPISKKGYRGEEAYSLIDQKKRPSKTETSAMTICKKEGCCQLSSPQNSNDLCLDPQKPDTQEQARLFCRNWELYTRDSALRGLSPRLSTPNICTHIPKMFPLRWNGCKFLSCRILSKQTAMNCTLQLV